MSKEDRELTWQRLYTTARELVAACRGLLTENDELRQTLAERTGITHTAHAGREAAIAALASIPEAEEKVLEGLLQDINGEIKRCIDCGGYYDTPGPRCPCCVEAKDKRQEYRKRTGGVWFIVAIAITLATVATCVQADDRLSPLLDAVRQVESGGNDRAVGDGGRAKGPYQIWRVYWHDACQQGHVGWSYDKLVWDRAASEQVIRWYWQRYAPRGASFEVLARIHNGGPLGHKNPATVKYWQKVKKELERN